MRSYIFTAHERQVIRAFLDGKIPATDKQVGQIRWRMGLFKDLAGDVDLYLDLRRRLAESEAAVSA
jgi:hypothetical protein